MIKPKEREGQSTKKLRTFTKEKKSSDVSSPDFITRLREVWADEVEKLQATSFFSTEAAIKALVEAIVLRLDEGDNTRESREFVERLFMEDEMLRKEVESLFTFSRKTPL